jgi:hypothetical protein
VTVTTTLELDSIIQRRLLDAEVSVLQRYRDTVLTFIKGEWTGWEYKGRPPGAPRLVSQRKWTATVSSVESEASLIVKNEATTAKGEYYAGHVHRAGSGVLEYEIVWAEVLAKFRASFEKDLLTEIKKNLSAPSAPRKVPGGRSTRAQARSYGKRK